MQYPITDPDFNKKIEPFEFEAEGCFNFHGKVVKAHYKVRSEDNWCGRQNDITIVWAEWESGEDAELDDVEKTELETIIEDTVL